MCKLKKKKKAFYIALGAASEEMKMKSCWLQAAENDTAEPDGGRHPNAREV